MDRRFDTGCKVSFGNWCIEVPAYGGVRSNEFKDGVLFHGDFVDTTERRLVKSGCLLAVGQESTTKWNMTKTVPHVQTAPWLAAVILALLPVLFWLVFLYRRDRLKPEPLGSLLLTFGLGAASALVTLFSGFFVNYGQFMSTVVFAPIVEETFKFLSVYLVIFRRKEFDEHVDGIVYAGTAALGFAAFENVLYVLNAAQGGMWEFWSTAGLRAILAVPGHFLFSSWWGYALGRARFAGTREEGMKFIRIGILRAIMSHAIYNFVVSYTLGLAFFVILVMTVLWRLFNDHLTALRKLDNA